jgi:epoxide hydrolase
MNRLGYTRYGAQGGDVGAAVTDALGLMAPDGLLGIHLNFLRRPPPEVLSAVAHALLASAAFLADEPPIPHARPTP